MGIFGKLFKVSPEELKAREDAKRARGLIANQEWDQLVEVGKPAVKPLISCLKDSTDVDILLNAARILGRIGDVEAIEQLGFCIVSKEDALEDRFNWDNYNALMPVVASALAGIGKSDVEQIEKGLKKNHHSLTDGIPFMWALCEIGDRKAVEPVVNWIFSVGPLPPSVPGSFGTPLVYKRELLCHADLIRACVPPSVLPKLLGDYTDLILDIFAWKLVSYSVAADSMRFDVSRCSAAIQRLCEIETPISSNILQKVSKIDKLIAGSQMGDIQSRTDYVDFESHRQRAKDELERRGNPRHDASVYLNPGAWGI
ncbi:MAG: HEAT repeat domain-containing protein [Dehalococcoidia bacterium]